MGMKNFLLRLTLTFLLGAPTAARAQSVHAFRNVNVIAMDEDRVLENRTVIVRGDRISRIGPAEAVEIPEEANVIDARGKFLIPGLADMHVHFGVRIPDNELMLLAYVANGVTTIFNLNGIPSHLRLREKIRKAEILGPTMFTSGPIMRGFPPADAEEAERMVRAQKARGYDAIKPYNQVPAEAYWALIATAKELDLPVIGHAVRAVGIEGALKAGQHLAHGEEILYGYFDPPFRDSPRPETLEELKELQTRILDESKIPELVRSVEQAGIFVTPNLSAYHMIQLQLEDLDAMLARPEVRFAPANLRRIWGPERNEYTTRPNLDRFLLSIQMRTLFLRKLTKALSDAGVPLLMGTDAYGVANIVPGFSAHDDLQELVESGLAPYDALLAATRRPAEFFGQADEFGTIAEGLRADLVLLEGNPLSDIAETRRRAGVMLRGRWFDQSELDAMLEERAD